jgi:hypothetical protein
LGIDRIDQFADCVEQSEISMNMPAALALLVSSSSTTTPTVPGGFIAWLICWSQRRKEVGGFLLFYYWQVIGGVLISLIFLGIGLQTYVPESYTESSAYLLNLAAIVPSICMLFAQAMVAIMLLQNRTWKMLKLLRMAIVVSILVEVGTLVIEFLYLKNDLGMLLGALSIASYTAFALYFFLSKRVRHVFYFHDWSEAVKGIYPERAMAQ